MARSVAISLGKNQVKTAEESTMQDHERITAIDKAIQELEDRTDPFARLTDEEFDRIRGRALAIDPVTFEILWTAASPEELEEEMAERYEGKEWAYLAGPPLGTPVDAQDLP